MRSALGGRVKRVEDRRLITGAGRYTDDNQPEGCLHAVFIRSTMAHARITGVDASTSRAIPGVSGVSFAADLAFGSENAPPRLCADEVKFVSILKPDVDLRRTVGRFTTIFPFQLACVKGQNASAMEILDDIRHKLDAVPHHGIGYGLLRYVYAPTATLVRCQ